MHCSFAQFVITVTIFSCVALSHAAPASVPWEKVSCLQREMAAKAHWKTCIKENSDNPNLPSYDNLNIATQISTHSFADINVPTNDMLCYKVDRYDYTSLFEAPDCPSLCKLRDPVEEKGGCDEDEKENVKSYQDGEITVIMSPNYNCSRYHRGEICIYNVSMSCTTDHVVVANQLSELDIGKKDFVQVVDYTHQTVYEQVMGTEWPKSQVHITSTDFAIVFWSDKDWKRGKGFKLHLECASKGGQQTPEASASGSSMFEQS